MKAGIIILLIMFLAIYTNANSTCPNNINKINERFISKNIKLDTSNENVANMKSILTNNTLSENIHGFDENDNYWIIKQNGFSDIFNSHDDGSFEVKNNTVINEGFANQPVSNDLVYQDKTYKLVGVASNQYYNQYYLLYENEIKAKDTPFLRNNFKYIKYNIYHYALVKIENGKQVVIHAFGPRSKIEINDIVNLSVGNFQLGPLLILNYNQ
jgi:hypothetical protein